MSNHQELLINGWFVLINGWLVLINEWLVKVSVDWFVMVTGNVAKLMFNDDSWMIH